MTPADQTFIDLQQDLFGATDRTGADDRQPERYAENGQAHAARPIALNR